MTGVPVGGVMLKLYRRSLPIFKDANRELLNFGFFSVGPIITLPPSRRSLALGGRTLTRRLRRVLLRSSSSTRATTLHYHQLNYANGSL